MTSIQPNIHIITSICTVWQSYSQIYISSQVSVQCDKHTAKFTYHHKSLYSVTSIQLNIHIITRVCTVWQAYSQIYISLQVSVQCVKHTVKYTYHYKYLYTVWQAYSQINISLQVYVHSHDTGLYMYIHVTVVFCGQLYIQFIYHLNNTYLYFFACLFILGVYHTKILHLYCCRWRAYYLGLFSAPMAIKHTVTQDIRLQWSSPRTRDTHTCCWTFGSGVVTSGISNLGPFCRNRISNPDLPHAKRMLFQLSYRGSVTLYIRFKSKSRSEKIANCPENRCLPSPRFSVFWIRRIFSTSNTAKMPSSFPAMQYPFPYEVINGQAVWNYSWWTIHIIINYLFTNTNLSYM